VRSDIAESRGTKKGVADRVRQYVCVGVAHEPFLEWYLDSPEYQPAAFNKPMDVVPYSNPVRFGQCHFLTSFLDLALSEAAGSG
jgi:hypothetical protein